MPSRFRWNAAAGRYIAPSGRFLSQGAVRAALDGAIETQRRRIRELAEQLRTRKISLRRWTIEMRTAIKTVHLTSAALATGGWAQMAPADYGRAGRVIRDQYAYLERFARQMRAGLPLDGRFLSRTDLYVEAGRGTYHAVERAERRARGLTHERNVLHPADHCTGAGSCVEQTDRDWVEIGELLPIGQRLCRARCRCTLEYR